LPAKSTVMLLIDLLAVVDGLAGRPARGGSMLPDANPRLKAPRRPNAKLLCAMLTAVRREISKN
jgi:hypothetical protein